MLFLVSLFFCSLAVYIPLLSFMSINIIIVIIISLLNLLVEIKELRVETHFIRRSLNWCPV